jgi:CheY-like chemotaxis protein
VTERRRAEHALHEVDRRKNEFLATLAHELRNPLAPIRHATEILSRGAQAPDGRARDAGALAVIERQVTHLVRLIDDLLDVSRIMHGKLELRRQPILLTEMVESALEASRPLFLARHHTLDVALPEEPLPVFGDPVRLTQILTNLLSNAARYTEPGGRVRVNAARDGDAVVIRIIDSGIGIPAAELAHIFTMFGQATRERESSEAGLGIGLAVAKRLTEMHGGTLTAASEGERAGSIFTLHLPLGPQFPGIVVAEGAFRSRSQPGVPRRVLVVDDNVDAALTLAELLSLDGHETFVAHDGPSAVAEAERALPEVAVLDIGLPGFDGLEVARRLRAKPELTGILLVALSGWVQPADRERSSAAGFDYHLAKPVDLTTLRRLLTEVGARPAAA